MGNLAFHAVTVRWLSLAKNWSSSTAKQSLSRAMATLVVVLFVPLEKVIDHLGMQGFLSSSGAKDYVIHVVSELIGSVFSIQGLQIFANVSSKGGRCTFKALRHDIELIVSPVSVEPFFHLSSGTTWML
jgi:hypothetical protein